LVNNAGIIQAGPLDCMTLDDYEQAMATHFWGPLYLIESALPMLRASRGRVVNICSIGGEVSVPHLTPYCASKFALSGLSQGLTTSLREAGISVTTVYPGLMRTGSPRNAEFKGNHRAEYAWFSISDSIPGVSINSRRAASQILEACRRGQGTLRISAPAKVAPPLSSLFPNLTTSLLSLVNRLLPRADTLQTEARRGDQSFSSWSPSILTSLTERAAARNNQIRPR
jgi:NAD(P)-dependent dehydrogenase (short-subunit alcohol dehydrogenase family)